MANHESSKERRVPVRDKSAVDIRQITDEQFKMLGVSHMAYVKVMTVDGERAFAIHAADGTPMALANDQSTAVAAILQQEMIPALVH